MARHRSPTITSADVQKVLVAHIENLVGFCHTYNIRTTKQLREFHLKEAVSHTTWKLLEVEGKYNSRFISGGVHDLEGRFGVKPNSKSGKWPSLVLENLRTDGDFDNNLPTKQFDCRFDHVISRQFLVEALISGQINASELKNYLLKCIVLEKEHQRLNRLRSSSEDPWSSYRELGIEVFDRKQNRYLNLRKESEDTTLRNLCDK